MKYGIILSPFKNHKYLNIEGQFISRQVFISKTAVNIGDIIICDNSDWFLIQDIRIREALDFEYVGIIVDIKYFENLKSIMDTSI